MNDFRRDKDWQRRKRDAILAPGFYGQRAQGGRYVFLDKGKFATILQRRYAADTILQGKDGEAVCIEEKIVRWPRSGRPHQAFCLETDSCTKPGHESQGWMHYGEADYLLYCFEQADGSLDCHLIDFPQLKAWFWPRVASFHTFGPLETLNGTMGKKVPIALLRDPRTPVRAFRFHVPLPAQSEAA